MNAPSKADVLAELERISKEIPEKIRDGWLSGAHAGIDAAELLAVKHRTMDEENAAAFWVAYLSRMAPILVIQFGLENARGILRAAMAHAEGMDARARERTRFEA